MQRFESAKMLLSALVVVGWIMVGLACLIFIFFVGELSVPVLVGLCSLLTMQGFLVVAIAQLGLAQIATAENTRDMLTFFDLARCQTGKPTSNKKLRRACSALQSSETTSKLTEDTT